jgi:membrane protease YdiL (CAAX protease family)
LSRAAEIPLGAASRGAPPRRSRVDSGASRDTLPPEPMEAAERPAEEPAESPVPAPRAARRRIEPPRPSGPVGAVLIFAALCLYAAFILLPRVLPRVSGDRVLTVAAVALPVLAALLRARAAIHLCVLLSLTVLWQSTGAPPVWPFYLLVPLLAYAGSMAAARRLRRDVGWLRTGGIDRTTLALMGATVLVSSGALLLWVKLARPDLRDIVAMVPAWNAPMLVVAGAVFSVVNAAMEEAIWRGVMLEALDSALGPGAAALLVQAASFGVAHIAGFPRGALGVAMAGTYGLMLGVIRRQSRGMLAPLLAHVAADATIFAILVVLLRHVPQG